MYTGKLIRIGTKEFINVDGKERITSVQVSFEDEDGNRISAYVGISWSFCMLINEIYKFDLTQGKIEAYNNLCNIVDTIKRVDDFIANTKFKSYNLEYENTSNQAEITL